MLNRLDVAQVTSKFSYNVCIGAGRDGTVYLLVLTRRGSAQFFLRIYQLALQATFRADFTMEQLGKELGLVVDQLWPAYEKAVREAGMAAEAIGTELVLGGCSPRRVAWWPRRMPGPSAGSSRACSRWLVA